MSTSNRIVLLSSVGEALFSDSCLVPPSSSPATLPAARQLARAAETEGHPIEERDAGEPFVDEEEDEPIPETLRSSVFVRAHEPVSRPIVIEMVDPEEDHRAA